MNKQIIFTSAVGQQIYQYSEGKTYVNSPAEAPRGIALKRGPRGGYYYDEPVNAQSKREEPKYYEKPDEKKPKLGEKVGDSLGGFQLVGAGEINDAYRKMKKYSEYGRCCVLAAFMHKQVGGTIKYGVYKGAPHSWVESDGFIYDLNNISEAGGTSDRVAFHIREVGDRRYKMPKSENAFEADNIDEFKKKYDEYGSEMDMHTFDKMLSIVEEETEDSREKYKRMFGNNSKRGNL